MYEPCTDFLHSLSVTPLSSPLAAAAQGPAARDVQQLQKELFITKKWRIRLFSSSLSLKQSQSSCVTEDGVGSVLCMRNFGFCEGK